MPRAAYIFRCAMPQNSIEDIIVYKVLQFVVSTVPQASSAEQDLISINLPQAVFVLFDFYWARISGFQSRGHLLRLGGATRLPRLLSGPATSNGLGFGHGAKP